MRIGIYNRWLSTMGGGERETAAFAQALQAAHHVELLAHEAVDLAQVALRLNIPLGTVALRRVALDPVYAAVTAASADYDLFVNMSHGDMVVPMGRRNVLRVFFPSPVEPDGPPTGSGTASEGGTRLHLIRGFYAPEEQGAESRLFAWTGRRAEFVVERPSDQRAEPTLRMPALELHLRAWRPHGAPPAEARLLAGGRPLGTCLVPADGRSVSWRLPLPNGLARSRMLDVTLETTTFVPAEHGSGDDRRELGIALEGVRLVDVSWVHAWRPQREVSSLPDRHAYEAMRAGQVLPAAQAYDLLLANSEYTRRWIERRWSLPSELLYPPVAVEDFTPGAKRNIILSVGRFFAGSHNKKHLPMIAAFRSLCERGLAGWEFHLVGGSDQAIPEQRAYLEQVRAAAHGYPVKIHANLPFAELKRLYGEAKIFWHATGYDEDEERAPERFEHFGITTVEAMAAGCVPVAIGRGGQPEIIEDGRSGYLWQTLEELQARTRTLVEQPEAWVRLAVGAQMRSRIFDSAHFQRRVEGLVAAVPGVG